MKKICFATNNAHKLEEVREIIGNRFEIVSLKEAGFDGELPETHETLEENSQEKAAYLFEKLQIPVFSDDSGLEIVALNGRPGVHSAHYAGDRDAQKNMAKVLDEMEGFTSRGAQFRAVITYIDGAKELQFEGVVPGTIAMEQHGEDGFGYDPIFFPEGADVTFAQMTAEQKNEISHRKRAVEKLAQFLNSYL